MDLVNYFNGLNTKIASYPGGVILTTPQ
jgi:hypothetical protein